MNWRYFTYSVLLTLMTHVNVGSTILWVIFGGWHWVFVSVSTAFGFWAIQDRLNQLYYEHNTSKKRPDGSGQ